MLRHDTQTQTQTDRIQSVKLLVWFYKLSETDLYQITGQKNKRVSISKLNVDKIFVDIEIYSDDGWK